jgi:hypothetical protein
MRQELDKLLCEKYPKMMVNRNKSMMETTMCWGFECGDGWFNLLNQLMSNIQHYTDWNNDNFAKGYKQYKQVPQVTLDQVKEKFGTLRFYYTGGDEHISGMVRMAESMSAVTCESCGNPGEQTRGGWIKTVCNPCNQKREEEYARQTTEYETKKETKNELNYQFISEDTGDRD